jgi:predicted permease
MLRRTHRDEDLDKELRSHVEQQIADYVAAGIPMEEARRRARVEFGGLLQVREAVRDVRRWAFLEILTRDVRHAIRSLIASPAFTLAAVLSLGLGIGANTAIFTIVDALMLRPLAVSQPASLTFLAFPRDATHFDPNFSADELREIQRRAASTFSGISAMEIAGLFGPAGRTDGLTVDSITRPVQTLFVSGGFFQMLGIQPHLGRVILPSEGSVPGGDPVAVLSYNYWQRRFHGDPAVLNKPALINGRAVTIVGIAPKGFLGPTPIIEMEAYLPLGMRTVEADEGTAFVDDPRRRELLIVARLAPGTTLDGANAVLASLAPQLLKDFPRERVSGPLRARPLRPPGLVDGPNPLPTLAAIFFVLAGLVFALACLNVTNLTLVRTAARRRELAVRAALGGSRARLVRHLVTETLLLALLGGAVGMLAGVAALRALAEKITAATVPITLDFSFDARVFLFAIAIAMTAAAFVGVLPALRVSSGNLTDALRDGGRSATRNSQRFRTALVAVQVGGTMALLIAAGLFLRSLDLVQRADLGFDGRHVLNVRLDPGEIGYSEQRGLAFYRELLARVRTLPGVESASVATTVPLADDAHQAALEVQGYVPAEGETVQADVDAVSPGFFQTLKIPLIAGRAFADADNADRARVAVINEAMAARFWRGQNPVGRAFMAFGDRSHPVRVVGVVRNSRIDDPYSSIGPAFYVPFAQAYAPRDTLQIRTTGPPEALAQDVLTIVRTIAPALPVLDARTMTDAVANGDSGFFIFTIGAVLTGALGLLGLGLAVVGIYGVMAYAVGQRTHEIGIRLALGATRSGILWLVSRQGLAMVSIGLLLGAAAAVGTGDLIQGFLVGVKPMDPLTYAAVSLLLAGAALAACYVPLRRATRVDPLIALRQE